MSDSAAMLARSQDSELRKSRRAWYWLGAVLAAFAAGYLVYSQTTAFVWDEGFHLVAAQLIAWGKTPYIDFAFPQTLLNAYFNAGVLRAIGDRWQAVHVFDALFTIATIALAAIYVMRRFPEPRWRLACAVLTACLIGLNTTVVGFGPIAQAYGSGMFLLFTAYLLAVAKARGGSAWAAFVIALLAGAAAGSTLLTAPAVPVLFVWVLLNSRGSMRTRNAILFIAGVLIAFTPEIVLFVRAPQQTWFNVVRYQAMFRRVNWGDVGAHDFDVLTDWSASAETLLLAGFALLGLLYISKRSGWPRDVRREHYLAFAIALALGIYIATAHPTFGRYFIFMIPFLAILASAGFYHASTRLFDPERPFWPSALLVLVLATAAAKFLFDDRDATHWSDYEKIAAKIHEVTPQGQEYFADEMVYFLLKQQPPSGMEFSYSHKIELAAKEEALYHTISLKELKEQVAHGRFFTFETCKDEIMDDFELDKHYPHKQEFDDCTVYWR